MKIRRVLFPTDFSETADEALAQAAEVARFFSAELIVLHVLQPIPSDTLGSDTLYTEVRENLEAISDTLEKDARQRISALSEVPELAVHKIVRWGDDIAPMILEQAAVTAADLIVMATHGRRGLRRWLVGSVTQEVVREADVPVLTLRRREHGLNFAQARNFLVPIDFSAPSREALAYARQLAALADASLELLHVTEIPVYPTFYGTPIAPPAAAVPVYEAAALRKKSAEELASLIEKTPGPKVPFRTHVEEGLPAERILEALKTRPIDLVVMASQGLTGLSRLLLGSVTEAVMRRANRPLLVVHTSNLGSHDPASSKAVSLSNIEAGAT